MLSAGFYLQHEKDINVHKYTVGDDSNPHTHDFIEIAYISDGKGFHRIGEDYYKVSKGDLVILNAFVPHQFVSDLGTPLIIYNCIFLPPALDQNMNETSNFIYVAYHYLFHSFHDQDSPKDFIKLKVIPSVEIESVFHEMCQEYSKKREGYQQVMKSDLMRLLIFIFRLYKDDAQQVQNNSVYKNLLVENIIVYMQNNYSSNIRIEDLANQAYISKGYLSRVFKEVTGSTIIQALQRIRMNAAGELLRQTNFCISDIAARVGYSDLKYFYKLFTEFYGITPGEYRSNQV